MIGDTIRTIIDLLMLRKTERKLDADIKKSAVDTEKATLDVQKLPLDIEKARLDLQKLPLDIEKARFDLARARQQEHRCVGIIHPDSISMDDIFRYDPQRRRILRASDDFLKSHDIRRFQKIFPDEAEIRQIALGIFSHMKVPRVSLNYVSLDREIAPGLWAELVRALCDVRVHPMESEPSIGRRHERDIDAAICILSRESIRQPGFWHLLNGIHAAGIPVVPVLRGNFEVDEVLREGTRTEPISALGSCTAYVRYDDRDRGGRLPVF